MGGEFEEAFSPEHRRLAAWALLRFLGIHGAFPAEPRELRHQALVFIEKQLGHDLKAHRIDFSLQSHEVEDALSQVVPSIERELTEAVTFRGFETFANFERTLLQAVNSNRTSPLLHTFVSRSLVADALKGSLQAVRAFLDADESMILELYEQAYNICVDAQASLNDDGTKYAGLVCSVPRALQGALESRVAKLDLAQPASLTLRPIAKKYPFHLEGANIDIRLVLENPSSGTAFDAQVVINGATDVEIPSSDRSVGTLAPGTRRTLHFPARVLRRESMALLSATLHWVSFDRQTSSTTIDIDLEAQDPNIDWDALSVGRPYSLDVATGSRFVGRDSLLERLRGHVDSPNPGSLYLWGQKRVGKTSLVQALATSLRAADTDFAVVYLETIRELTPQETTDGICRRLASQLKSTDVRFADVPDPPATGSLSPLGEFLDRLHTIAPEKRFLLIIDEFDELPLELYKSRGVADTFFQTLGKGIAGKPGVGVVLVGGERMRPIVRAQGMRLNMYRPEHVDHFEEGRDFDNLVRIPGHPLEFTDDAVALLWNYSAGNPYFLNEICTRLAEAMIGRRDAHVAPEDVEDAILSTLRQIDSNSFAHYWADGLFTSDAEPQDPIILDRVRFLVSVAELLIEGGSHITPEALGDKAVKHGCSSESVDRLLREFRSRGILIEESLKYRIRVGLFEAWLREKGYLELSTILLDDLNNLEEIEKARETLVTDDQIGQMVDKWGPYQGDILGTFKVRQWLNQFSGLEEQRLMFQLLQKIEFWDEARIRRAYEQCHRTVVAGLSYRVETGRERRRDIIVSYVGAVARSGPSMARMYRQQNKVWNEHLVAPDELEGALNETGGVQAVVFVDDFVGTGRTASSQFGELWERYPGLVEQLRNDNVNVTYAVAVGTEAGLAAIRRSLEGSPVNVVVVAGEELGPEAKAFEPEARIWLDEDERALAREIAESWGKRLEGRSPLGHGNSQGLVVFGHNCPNTSLPILHKRRKALGEAFSPLFPRSS